MYIYANEAVGGGGATAADDGGRKGKEVASYWGVPPSRVVKDDGSEWKWNCFRVAMGDVSSRFECVLVAAMGLFGGGGVVVEDGGGGGSGGGGD
ncbi:hypothetical protein QVD17_32271 [Tagetes erecta]|uniref:Uncharacterized protein n=1 Tax=Tagetes erecta TaxID=13708 RepID=A0AAD8K4X6_TARER|nr:hypothetical protein QVD17_32271 [Tagetes erecta]